MTDEQLIEQIEQGSPEDISAEQLALIRSRLAGSPALAAALAERLRVEQYLAGALGADNVSKTAILERAGQLRQSGGTSKRAVVGWITGLGLASVALFFAVRPFLPRRAASLAVEGRIGIEKSDRTESNPDGATSIPRAKPGRTDREDGLERPSYKSPSIVAEGAKPQAKGNEDADPPRPLRDVIFQDVGADGNTPRESDLTKWFTAVPARRDAPGYRFSERMVQNRRCGSFDGWVKLRAAWPKDGMLRLALADYDLLRLHFYHGTTGVTLQYYEDQSRRAGTWAAYAITREAGDTRPKEPVLVGTDEDRSYRSSPHGAGPIDIMWRDGELRVTRGDVQLLAAPLPGPPTDVFFEGHAGFRGLALVRTTIDESLDTPVVADHPIKVDTLAAGQEWATETPSGSSFTKLDNGSVELAAEKTKSPAWAAWKLPRRELCEIMLELDHASPGMGVYVADEHGRPMDVLRFFREQGSGRTAVGLAGVGDTRYDQDHDPRAGPILFASSRPWVKLVVGCGILRTWIGPDGMHWAPAATTTQNVPAPFATIGLFCKASESRRAIRLKRIVVRELDGLTKLAQDATKARARAFSNAENFADWLQQTSAAKPPDVEVDEWRRACALATLGQGAHPRLGMPLLTTLLDDVLASRPAELSVAARLKAISDAALVANTWENHAEALLYSARYRWLGERLFQSGEPRPYSLLRAAQMQCPVASRQGVPAGVASLARLELLAAVYEGRWEELDRLCRNVRFWQFGSPSKEGPDSLTDWAQAIAAERVGHARSSRSAAMLTAWRHPLEEQTNADVFNLMAEFNAALDSKAYQDAAGTIASAGGTLLDGDSASLLADARDRDLFVSLAGAVRLAMRDHPLLAKAMNQHFGPVARQRVQRAMSEGDRVVLEAATVQFYGTEAASMAHAWLGNAALVLGEFAEALAHLEQAMPHAAPGDRGEIAARARLAAAYLGRELGAAATTAVTVGDHQFTANEFEDLVQRIRKHGLGRGQESRAEQVRGQETRAGHVRGWEGEGVGVGAQLDRGLTPAAYRLEKRGEFDAGSVARPAEAPADDARNAIDWFARQSVGVVVGDQILFTAPTAATAFDRRTGSEKWRSGPSSPRGQATGSSASSVAPSRPMPLPGRIFVRRSPTLVALDRENGATIWEARLERQESVISDPLWVGGRLLAIVARQDERETVTTLTLAAFDLASGDVRWRRPLARLRSSWSSQPVCQAMSDDQTIYAALGGVILGCNSAGQIRWLRRSERVPPAVDPWSLLQAHDRPIAIGERLVVAQPGVRVVECLESATGRRHWSRVFPDLLSIVGVATDFVVVQSRDAIVGLKLGSGDTAWRYETDGGCRPLGCSAENGVLVARTDNRRLALVWIDAKTGGEVGRTNTGPVGSAEHPDMLLGPIVADSNGRGWALSSRDEKSARRDLCELIKVGPAEPPTTMKQESAWSRHAGQN